MNGHLFNGKKSHEAYLIFHGAASQLLYEDIAGFGT